MRTHPAPDPMGSAMSAAAPAPAPARPVGTVFTRSTGTVHALRSGDATRTVCGRDAAPMASVPADAWSRVALCSASCARCGYPAPSAPAAVDAPAPSPVDTSAAAAVVRYADPLPSSAPHPIGTVRAITHDGTPDVMVTWRGCIVGARFHDIDAAYAFASLPAADRDAARPDGCRGDRGAYGTCVRQRSHPGRCADAHGHRFDAVTTSVPWDHPARTLPIRDTVPSVHAWSVVRPPALASRAYIDAVVAGMPRRERDRIARVDGTLPADAHGYVTGAIMADADTLRTGYRPSVPAPAPRFDPSDPWASDRDPSAPCAGCAGRAWSHTCIDDDAAAVVPASRSTWAGIVGGAYPPAPPVGAPWDAYPPVLHTDGTHARPVSTYPPVPSAR